jgi:hypothetical protein
MCIEDGIVNEGCKACKHIPNQVSKIQIAENEIKFFDKMGQPIYTVEEVKDFLIQSNED